jgi:uroporphyrinogen decarboxylase
MRQAGRALPEYRTLKETHSFLELVQTPALAAEVTLQPIRRFGFDAAVFFSDILIAAEGLGQPYRFEDEGGIKMDFAVRSLADLDRLEGRALVERLQYVGAALRLVRAELGERTALLGFAGSPWTLANFMMEGGSGREFVAAKRCFYTECGLFDRLCEMLTSAVVDLLQLQIDAGVDAVQIFDSLGGLLAANAWEEASGRWLREIIVRLRNQVPVVLFAKGVQDLARLRQTGAQVLSLDWTTRLAEARAQLPPSMALQGNLDPFVMTTTPEVVEREAEAILASLRGQPGHIFNLGHGLPPKARLENIEKLVTTVRNFG